MSVAEYSRRISDVAALRSPGGKTVQVERAADGGLEIRFRVATKLTFPVGLLRKGGGDASIVAERAADVLEAHCAVLVAAIRAHVRRFDDYPDDGDIPIDETSVIP